VSKWVWDVDGDRKANRKRRKSERAKLGSGVPLNGLAEE